MKHLRLWHVRRAAAQAADRVVRVRNGKWLKAMVPFSRT